MASPSKRTFSFGTAGCGDSRDPWCEHCKKYHPSGFGGCILARKSTGPPTADTRWCGWCQLAHTAGFTSCALKTAAALGTKPSPKPLALPKPTARPRGISPAKRVKIAPGAELAQLGLPGIPPAHGLEYLLKAQLNISEEEFKHCRLFPIYGSGQGSAASPAIWCLISCRLLEIHSDYAHGASYRSPDGKVTAKAHMIGLVDGTYGAANNFDFKGQSIEGLLKLAKGDAQLWSALLEAAGGALELPKLKCHAAYFGFSNTGSSFMKSPEKNHVLQFGSEDTDGRIVIEPLEPTQARKMLGCFAEPAGSNNASLEHITKLAMKRAAAIYSSGLDSRCAWQHYRGIFLPSVAYSFAVSSISRTQLENLQQRAARMYLPRLGYSRSTPKAIVYGPAELGGIGFFDFYLEQGLAALEMLAKHLRADTEAGKHILIALPWSQYIAGASKPILEGTSTSLPHLKAMAVFFPAFRSFMNSIGARLQLPYTGVAPIQREHGSYIMDAVIASKQFKNWEIPRVNYMRLWLDAHTVSDMATAAGDAIDESLIEGDFKTCSSLSRGQGANQAQPICKDTKKAWRRAWKLLVAGKSKRLKTKLGKWLVPVKDLRRSWRGFYSPSQDSLIRKYGPSIIRHKASHEQFFANRRLYQDGRCIEEWEQPSDMAPVDFQQDAKWRYTANAIKCRSFIFVPSEPSATTDFYQHILALPDAERTLLEQVTFLRDPMCVVNDMLQAKDEECLPYAASDGSVIPAEHKGAFGWVIAIGKDEEARVMECKGQAAGFPMASYRAEAFGIWSLLLTIVRLFEYHGEDPASIVAAVCGNKGLVSKVDEIAQQARPQFPNDTLQAGWDAINEIIILLERCKVVSLAWIKAHQDEKAPYQKLPYPAKLSCIAGGLAGQAQSKYSTSLQALQAPHNAAQVAAQGKTIHSKLKPAIRKIAQSAKLLEFVKKEHKFTDEVFGMIGWKAHERAISSSKVPAMLIKKLIHNLLPFGKLAHKYKPYYPPQCMPCPAGFGLHPADPEDRCHFLLCQNAARRKLVSEMATDVRAASAKMGVSFDLTAALMDYLLAHCSDAQPSWGVRERYQQAMESQEEIGPIQLFLGRFSKKWGETHEMELKSNGTNIDASSSGLAWVPAVARVIWKYLHKMWLERNSDRHGHDEEEKRNRVWQQNIREIKMWYQLKEEGRLGLDEEEQLMLYDNCAQHECMEGPAALIDVWLCTSRPALQQCKHRATERRKKSVSTRRGTMGNARDGSDFGNGIIVPARNEVPNGDDDTVTSDLPDADFGTEIEFGDGVT